MQNLKVFPIVLCAVFVCATLVPGARASQWDKKTIVTFTEAIEIPGQVLEPGTYVFKLFDSSSNRNIVQVWNEDEDHLLATILAIADEQPQANDKSVFYLDPTSGGPGLALRAWFYAGEKSGQQFVYPSYPTNDVARSTGSVR
jgi:hypothetical protein